MPDVCPTEADLLRMLDDGLAPTIAETMEAHVSSCLDCQQKLERLTDHPLPGGGFAAGIDDTKGDDDPTVKTDSTLMAHFQGEPTHTIGPGSRELESTIDSFEIRLPDLPGYQIERELGRGGMGVVYLARQIHANRLVALKMVLANRGRPEDLVRFLMEGESLARLQHPNIVQVYEVGESRGMPFFTMEYVEGGTLADLLAQTPGTAESRVRLIETIARAVHAAHQCGVVHRDLKPANILLSEKSEGGKSSTASQGSRSPIPKVTDFGLAKRVGSDSGLTHTGQILGTPSYMAPEQASGNLAVGVPADVYALGSILYEVLSGRPPFKGDTPWETMMRVVHEPVEPLSKLGLGIPFDLEVICLKCLHKIPSDRYASADALAEDLRRYLAGEPILARPVSTGRRLWLWGRRRPAVASLAGLFGLAVVAGAAGVLVQWRRAEQNLSEARSNFTLARRAVDDLLTRISEDKLVAQPGFQSLRRDLLESAAGYYREFATQRQNDPVFLAEVVRAHTRLGKIAYDIDTPEQAQKEYLAAINTAKGQTGTDLNMAKAEALAGLADSQRNGRRLEESLRTIESGLALVQDRPGKPLVDIAARMVRARCLDTRAVILGYLGRREDETNDIREAIRLRDAVAKLRPKTPGIEYRIALGYLLLGNTLARQSGKVDMAVQALKESEQRFAILTKTPSPSLAALAALADVKLLQGSLFGSVLGLREEAYASFERARSILGPLEAQNPMVAEFRLNLLGAEYELGYTDLRRARYRDAARHYGRASELLDRLIRDDPAGLKRFARNLGAVLVDLAESRRLSGSPAEAVVILRDRCLPGMTEALSASPENIEIRLGTAMTHRYLARALIDSGDAKGAIEHAREATTLLEPVASSKADALFREELAQCYIVHGDGLIAIGDDRSALGLYSQAIEVLGQLVAADPQAADRADALGYALARRSIRERKISQTPNQADEEARSGLKLLEALPKDDPIRWVRIAIAKLAANETPENALKALETADTIGLANAASLKLDPDFETLRTLESFQKLITSVEARSRESLKADQP